MSYHRGEPYVWESASDGFIHIWSNLREDPAYNSGVRIEARIFDEIVVRRFCDMIKEERVPPAILGACKKMGGKFLNEMLKAARQEAK